MDENTQIRIGIILPVDKITEISLNIPNPLKYKINSGKLTKNLHIKSKKDSLVINDVSTDIIKIEPENGISLGEFLSLKSVPTGRGFHWQRTIDVKFPGKIIIKNINGLIHVINELSIEEYLPYVATAEMSPDCPQALLEAQTIAARSWLLANRKVNHPELNIDVCNDDCCQRYQGITKVPDKSLQAIQNTYGHVLQYRNEICDARYSKCCGGITESFENVWGGDPIPYLSSVSDSPIQNNVNVSIEKFINSSPAVFCGPKYIEPPEVNKYIGKVDKDGSYYRWKISYSQKELTAIINDNLNIDAERIINITTLKRGYSGRIIELKIDYVDKNDKEKSITLKSEYEIRNALDKKFLYSSVILIEQVLDDNRHIKLFNLKGAGWGHGVGLCQIGALGMALNGYSTKEILLHYFKSATIEKIY